LHSVSGRSLRSACLPPQSRSLPPRWFYRSSLLPKRGQHSRLQKASSCRSGWLPCHRCVRLLASLQLGCQWKLWFSPCQNRERTYPALRGQPTPVPRRNPTSTTATSRQLRFPSLDRNRAQRPRILIRQKRRRLRPLRSKQHLPCASPQLRSPRPRRSRRSAGQRIQTGRVNGAISCHTLSGKGTQPRGGHRLKTPVSLRAAFGSGVGSGFRRSI
jgi:hypothetical protein